MPLLQRGLGARVWDVNGGEYLDSVSGTNGPAAVGHSHRRVAEAVAKQMISLPSHSCRHDSTVLVDFATKMAGLTPDGLTKTMLCAGGAEAIEAAVKLAIRVTGRPAVLSLDSSYHGLSLGTMSLCGIGPLRDWLPDGARLPAFGQLPSRYTGATAPSDADLERAVDGARVGRVAAIVVEPLQAAGGQLELDPAYGRALSRICRERDIVLIADEIQTGLGRCGDLWASARSGLEPDIVVCGKALGGGVPIGSLSVRPEMADEELEATPWHMLTFMNQPLQAAAGLAVLRILEEESLVARAARLGGDVHEFLTGLADRYDVVGAVRGRGLFFGLELVAPGETAAPLTAVCRDAWDYAVRRGLLTWFSGAGNVLAFKPPLTTPEGDLDEMLRRLEEVVAFVEAGVASQRTETFVE